MKNRQRRLSLLLALTMLFTCICPPLSALAESDDAQSVVTSAVSEDADALYELGLFRGTGTDENGKPVYELERTMSRTEALVMFVRLLGAEDAALACEYSHPFTDVPDWADRYVAYAYENGLTRGIADTLFGADADATDNQYFTFLLRALGYEDGTDFDWEHAFVLTDKLGITSIDAADTERDFLRGEAVSVSRRALACACKGQEKTLLEVIGKAPAAEEPKPAEEPAARISSGGGSGGGGGGEGGGASHTTPSYTASITPYALSIAGDGVTLTCSADAGAGYQWYRVYEIGDDVAIVGATAASYTTPDFDTPEVRTYRCVASYTGGTAKSNTCSVAYTALPCVTVTTASGDPITSKETYVDGHITILDPQGETVDKDITIKGRGNSTWNMPKKGYTFKFDKKQGVLGLGKSKKWALIANYADKSLLRNVLASTLAGEVYNDSGMWQPEYVSVNVILNGEYRGVYTLAETIKIDGKRVDIPDISDKQEDGFTLDQGGFILEIDNRLDEMYHFQSSHGVNFCLSDPDLDDGSKNDFTAEQIVDHVKTVVQTAEDALFSDSFTDPATGYAKYLDVDSFIEWYLVNELTRNNDAVFHTSCFLYYDPADAKLHMGPVWDFDISCGNINYNGNEKTDGLWIINASWYARLFQDPAFAAQVKQCWNAKRTQLDTVVNTEIAARADKLRVGAALNFNRWPILGTYVWPNADGYAQRTTYQSEVDYLVNWLNARIAWLDTQWVVPAP